MAGGEDMHGTDTLTTKTPSWWRRHAIALGIAVLIVVPLYGLLWTLLLRSGLLDLSGEPPDNPPTKEQFQALLAFLGVALGVLATVVTALLTKTANDRALVQKEESEVRTLRQTRESENRQRLETAIAILTLIKHEGGYAGKAVTGAAIATLVVLEYPVIAMRTLQAAMAEKVIDIASAVWVIDQVLGQPALPAPQAAATEKNARHPKSDQKDLRASRDDATQLLFDHSAELTREVEPGAFHWPTCALGQWPAGLSLQCAWLLTHALLRMLMSQRPEWWTTAGSTWSWVVYTLHEITLDPAADPRLKQETSVYGLILLEAVPEGVVVGPRDQEIVAPELRMKFAELAGQHAGNADMVRGLREWVQDAKA